MSETHVNALLMEADEKEKEAQRLIGEANALRAEVNAREVAANPELAQPTAEPDQSSTDSEADKPGVFRKKK